MIGQTLGHYHILEKIGSGGMGEVYKARDTRLNRLVAVKILSPDKVADIGRKRRFILEAQSASALNHPNIVVIYDIDHQHGVDFMAMEYIEGKTLDQAMPRHGFGLNEALKIATQVADGLARAHSAGIIHRDVKPTNIMIAADGRVKLLDFGLAKLTEPGLPSEAETRTAGVRTGDGEILGTICYMSPEQAEGKKLDTRSDVFSFGSVLYEMLTGRKAFSASSRVATLSAVLREEPPHSNDLPPEVERILRRCLRKDPARRFQSMADVRVELDEVREESDSGSAPGHAPAASSGRHWFRPALSLAAALLLAALSGIGWYAFRTGDAPQLHLRQLTADSGLTASPSISPDGKLVAYVSDRAGDGNLDIWVQPLTEGARPIRVTRDPADDTDPSFSPDGGQLVFHSKRAGAGIYVVPTLGGDERLLVRSGYSPRFSPDGQWIAYSSGSSFLTESKVFVVPVAGGEAKRVGEDIAHVMVPIWSPDGKSLLLLGQDAVGAVGSQEYWLAPVGGGRSRKTEIGAFLRQNNLSNASFRIVQSLDWGGPSVLFTFKSAVWAFDMDSNAGKLKKLRKIATGTADISGVRGAGNKLVFSSGMDSAHLWTLPLDLNAGKVTGPLQSVSHAGGAQAFPASSSDGKILAYSQQNPGGTELRVRDRVAGRESVLFTGVARPKVSPDGSSVAFSVPRPAGTEVLIADSNGGQARKLADLNAGAAIYGWTADGHGIVYYRTAPVRFFLFDLRSSRDQEIIGHPTVDIHGAEPSPDLKWLAFFLPGIRNSPVKIAPLRDGRAAPESEWITVAEYPGRNSRPWWAPDGNLLYFISMKDNSPDIWAQRLHPATKRPLGEAFAVFHFHEARRTLDIFLGAAFGPAIGKGQITFSLAERTANIWIAEPAP